MKNSIFGLMCFSIIFLTSCEKENIIKTTYQVYNNNESYSSDVPYLDGSLYEVVVFCFAGDDVVREDNYTKIAVGAKTTIREVPEAVTKIKVSFRFLPKESEGYNLSANNRKYVVSYTLVEKGKNVIAEVNGNSMVSGSMAKEKIEKTLLKSIKQDF